MIAGALNDLIIKPPSRSIKKEKKMVKKAKTTVVAEVSTKKQRISQADIPSVSLDKALRVPEAIVENYASQPVNVIQLAKAMDMTPTSGPFRAICGAAIAYGLTDGGYNAGKVAITARARRIFKPQREGEDFTAKLEAFLQPRIIREFINHYNGSSLPKDEIACNVLEDMGVPQERVKDVYAMILSGAEDLGLISDIKGKKFLQTEGVPFGPTNSGEDDDTLADVQDKDDEASSSDEANDNNGAVAGKPPLDAKRAKRVFVAHGKNRDLIEPIRQLLKFGELEAVVAVEQASVSKPIPDKVMEDMRGCAAAIIHVDMEQRLLDQTGQEHTKLNDNVLIEIGAAMALYGRRFILLVKDGVKLPSNLQGLFEVRYNSPTLDSGETIKLLQAITSLKEEKII
jgi:predicted nucleotide-binding protein